MQESPPEEKSSTSVGSSSRTLRRTLYPAGIIILAWILLHLGPYMPLFRSLESWTYDMRVAYRHKNLFDAFQAPRHYRNPHITIVPVDDHTHRVIEDPTIFWTSHFAVVIDALLKNGAEVVGLDYMFKKSGEEYLKGRVKKILDKRPVEKESKEDTASVLSSLTEGDRRFFDVLRTKKVVLMAFINERGILERPLTPYAYAAGMENLGLVNSEPDKDGVVRSQYLYRKLGASGNGRTYLAFGLATACHLLGSQIRYDQDAGKIFLGDEPVPHDSRFCVKINYVGPPGTFMEDVSFADLLDRANAGDNDFFRDRFEGKAILIGPAFSGSNDLAQTPYLTRRSWEMYGVELHANFLNTLANSDYIRTVNEWISRGVLFILVTVFVLLCMLLRPHGALVAALSLVAGFTAAAVFSFYRYNLSVDMAGPLLALPLCFAMTYAYRYLFEDRERRFVRSVLARYVSESVAQKVLEDPSHLALGGKRMDISILFCDINDFTTLCEGSRPEEIIDILNEYFTRMERVIFDHKGTLKQFVGDEIMVICGAPSPDHDHAARICRIALAMVEELRRWQEERAAQGKVAFDVKFGMHCGEVVVGNIGSPRRTEYSAIGDVVNTTSRIMGLTKKAGAKILISDEMWQRVGNRFETRPAGRHPVKGREQEVEVHELLAVRERSDHD
ncbi:CHASE2 domain-containing protein [Acidobacteriota bacterium]